MISQITIDSCDPSSSVVIEACAGSGKTWLLVSRVLRILLDGAKPSEILAITFTRKAAQEMRGRLDEMLLKFANCSDDELLAELMQRGLSETSAIALFPTARNLFENVLSDPHGLAIDTFHGWFSRLLKGAPIGSQVPQGLTLREDFKRLQAECLEDWWTNLPKNESLRKAYELLVRELGSTNANDLLMGSKGFLSAKAEWYRYIDWCRTHNKSPSQAIFELSDFLEVENPLKQALSQPENLSSLMTLAAYLKEGGITDIKLSQAIYSGLQQFSNVSNLDQVAHTLRPAFLNADLQILSRISASAEKKSLLIT